MKSPMMQLKTGEKTFNIIQFEWVAVKNNFASNTEGRPIHDKVLKAYVSSPGQRNQMVSQEVERRFWAPEGEAPKVRTNQKLRSLYRELLNAWENDKAEEMAGTPLVELPGMDVAFAASLKEQKIHTIEMLASISDNDLNLFMGARKWRDSAKSYLEKSEGVQVESKLQAENASLKEEIEAMKLQIADLANKSTPPKKGNKAA